MRKVIGRFIFILLSILMVTSCAKRGSITGGLKDTIAPVLRVSFPKNFSTGFTGNTIRLTFDEYIKLKNLNKQLIISPPMKYPPEITPLTASQYINIRIKDTLLPNTTYSFNFGQSIEDNNESNRYPQFKYVFSTGTYIDSLKLSAMVKDAYSKNVEPFVSVMLYEINDRFTDSTVYKEFPRYITNTLDSLRSVTLENLKEGKYLLVAMKDYNSNNKFDYKTDKIGFYPKYIDVPNDTLYQVELFSEEIPFKTMKPQLAAGAKILLPYEGSPADARTVLRNGNEILPTVTTQVEGKDSLHVWFRPIKVDSLQLSVSNRGFSEEYNVKIKAQKRDTLSFTAKQSGTLPLRDNFVLKASRPLIKFDKSLMRIINKDSLELPFTTEYDTLSMQLSLTFEKEPLEKYTVSMLPGAVSDFYESVNDTLQYRLTTKNTSDYGNLRVTLQNVRRFPALLEITNEKGVVIASKYTEGETVIEFDALEPAVYSLRLIYDDNQNGVWDTGSFLNKAQPEEVIYYPKDVPVRANWDWEQLFTLP